jgi:cytochrome c oxidase cbb3-type subunit III
MNRERDLHFRFRRLARIAAILVFFAAPAVPRLWAQASDQSKTSNPEPPVSGQQLFSSTCAGCHGLDGRGGEHAPNIATNASIQLMPDAALLRIVRDGIPAAGMPGFGLTFNDGQIRAVVSYLRVLQGKGQTVALPGSPETGRTLFFGAAGCAGCHMVGGKGGFIATDLTGYGSTHSVNEIRTAITDPNKNLDPRRGTVVVHTRDGRRYVGVARNEDNFSIQLQTPDGAFHLLNKTDLVQVEHQPRSLMPGEYRATLTARQLNDLVSYLMAAAVRPAKAREDDEDE